MKVSIITVCYNSENAIEKTIQSVLSQDYKDIEYIIIDGNSKDKTLEIIKKYSSKISKIVSEPDKGIYDAINKGIVYSSGNIIGLLHADDKFLNNHVITEIVKTLKYTNSDAVYGDLQYLKGDKIFRNWTSGEFDKSKFKWGWMPPHPTFYCKKSCFDNFGLYNTSLSISADYELMLRFLYKNNCTVDYLPQVLIQMQVGGKSNATVSNRLKANKEDKLAWKINNLKPYWFTFLLKPLRKLGQFLSYYL